MAGASGPGDSLDRSCSVLQHVVVAKEIGTDDVWSVPDIRPDGRLGVRLSKHTRASYRGAARRADIPGDLMIG